MIHSHPSPWPWAAATGMLAVQLVLTVLLVVALYRVKDHVAAWWRDRRKKT